MMFEAEWHREDIEYISTPLMENKANFGKHGVSEKVLHWFCLYLSICNMAIFYSFSSCGLDVKINNSTSLEMSIVSLITEVKLKKYYSANRGRKKPPYKELGISKLQNL